MEHVDPHDDDPVDKEVFVVPIEDAIDLHTFAPRLGRHRRLSQAG